MIRFIAILSIAIACFFGTANTISALELINKPSVEDHIYHIPALDGQLSTVRETEPFKAQVTITNPYNRAGRIVRTDSTCVCTVLKVDKEFLLPGDSTNVHYEVPNERTSGTVKQIVWLYFSDPDFEPIEIRFRWNVQPLVAVDVLPPNHNQAARPEDIMWRDIYRLESAIKPNEATKLVKNLLISAVQEEMPEGGLKVLNVQYEGKLWQISQREVDTLNTFIFLRPADPDATLAQGDFEEKLVITTNKPGKETIEIEVGTRVDPNAGRPPQNPLFAPPGLPPGQ